MWQETLKPMRLNPGISPAAKVAKRWLKLYRIHLFIVGGRGWDSGFVVCWVCMRCTSTIMACARRAVRVYMLNGGKDGTGMKRSSSKCGEKGW